MSTRKRPSDNGQRAGEVEPLLGAHSQDRSTSETTAAHKDTAKSWSFLRRLLPRFDTTSPQYRWVPLLGCIILFVSEAEWALKQVALFRANEAMFCIEYYQVHDPEIARLGKGIPEKMCKADEIQVRVATISAAIMFVRQFCATVGTLVLGYIADRYGRRVVLIFHRGNVTLYVLWNLFVYLAYPLLPVWTIALGGATALVGGNFDVGMAMLFASYTDVIPDPVQRSKLFYLTNAMQYVAQAFLPLVGGILMNLDGKGGTPEIAIIASVGASVLSFLLCLFFFPETLDKSHKPSDSEEEHVPDVKQSTIAGKMKTRLAQVGWLFKGIGVLNMSLLCFSLFIASAGSKSIEWYGIVQYPVIKLGWTFPQAAPIVSAQAVVTILNYSFLVPWYTNLGAKHGLSSASTSLAIMLLSCVLYLIGATMMGFSASSIAFLISAFIYTLGTGLTIATQAYVAGVVDKSRIAKVLSVLSIPIITGKMLSSAVFPQLLAVGLASGVELLKGLPLFAAAGFFALSAILVIILGVRTRRTAAQQRQQQASEEEESLMHGNEVETGGRSETE